MGSELIKARGPFGNTLDLIINTYSALNITPITSRIYKYEESRSLIIKLIVAAF
jgi:hypothetical protein